MVWERNLTIYYKALVFAAVACWMVGRLSLGYEWDGYTNVAFYCCGWILLHTLYRITLFVAEEGRIGFWFRMFGIFGERIWG